MDNIIKITVIDRMGIKHQLEAPTDMNLNIMEICKLNELPVEGICGGMAMCASCHCYIESDTSLPEQGESEISMLAEAFHFQNNSRLGCQIIINSNIDGIVVRLAPD